MTDSRGKNVVGNEPLRVDGLLDWASRGGVGDAKTLPCIVCGVVLRDALGRTKADEARDGWCNQPTDGLAFTTHGHYGSVVFDPYLAPIAMHISVCDNCIRKNVGRIAVTETPRMPPSRKLDEAEMRRYAYLLVTPDSPTEHSGDQEE